MEGLRKQIERVARATMVAASLTGVAGVNAPKPAEAAQSYETNPYLNNKQESAEVAALMETVKQVYSLLGIGRGEGFYSLDMIHMNLRNGETEKLGQAAIATGVIAGLHNILKTGTLPQKHSAIDRARQLIESSSLPEITKASLRQSFEQVSGR